MLHKRPSQHILNILTLYKLECISYVHGMSKASRKKVKSVIESITPWKSIFYIQQWFSTSSNSKLLTNNNMPPLLTSITIIYVFNEHNNCLCI